MTPSWRTIQCDEHIPRPSPSYSALTEFSTSFSLLSQEYPSQIEDLLVLLASLSTATVLDLTIRTSVNVLRPLHLKDTLCPSVTSLTLRFPSFIFPKGIDEFLDPFMRFARNAKSRRSLNIRGVALRRSG